MTPVKNAIDAGCRAQQGTLTSPVSWLGPQLATQVWFVARRRALPENGTGRS